MRAFLASSSPWTNNNMAQHAGGGGGGDNDDPIFLAALVDAPMLLHLISTGASADVRAEDGVTPLMCACLADEPTARVTVPALPRASSRETLRAVDRYGLSAIDYLVRQGRFTKDWCQDVVIELLSSGAPVEPRYAARTHPIAARHGACLERRVAARQHPLTVPWQMHESIVELAFDFQDARAVEEGVQVRERRVHELEEALRALGVGTEDTDSDSDEEEEEGGESGEGGEGSEGGDSYEESGEEEAGEHGGGEEGGGEEGDKNGEEEGGEGGSS